MTEKKTLAHSHGKFRTILEFFFVNKRLFHEIMNRKPVIFSQN